MSTHLAPSLSSPSPPPARPASTAGMPRSWATRASSTAASSFCAATGCAAASQATARRQATRTVPYQSSLAARTVSHQRLPVAMHHVWHVSHPRRHVAAGPHSPLQQSRGVQSGSCQDLPVSLHGPGKGRERPAVLRAHPALQLRANHRLAEEPCSDCCVMCWCAREIRCCTRTTAQLSCMQRRQATSPHGAGGVACR